MNNEKLTMNKIEIRFAQKNDLPFIVDIYNQAIRSKCATGDLTEFTVDERAEWFTKFNKDKYPIYIAELESKLVGFCTISPYRAGREAMSSVAEISYYVDYKHHHKGIGTKLIEYVLSDCKRIGIENLIAILLDINTKSVNILKKFNFKQWGYFPDIVDIDSKKCSHLVYGLNITNQYNYFKMNTKP